MEKESAWRAWAWGFAQILCVSTVTVAIVNRNYALNFLGALAVNFFWIKGVNIASTKDRRVRLSYILGASIGSVTGAFLGNLLHDLQNTGGLL